MKLRRTPIVLAALATLALTSFSSISLADTSCPPNAAWGCEMGGYAASWDQFRSKVDGNNGTFTNWGLTQKPDYIVDAFYKPFIVDNNGGILKQTEDGTKAMFGGGAPEYDSTDFPTYTDFFSQDDKNNGQIISLDSVSAYPQKGDPVNPWSTIQNLDDTATSNNAHFISIGGWSYTNAWHEFFIKAFADPKVKSIISSLQSLDGKATPQLQSEAWEKVSAALMQSPVVQNFIKSLDPTNKYLVEGKAITGYDFDYENPGFMHGHSLEGLTTSVGPDGKTSLNDTDFTPEDPSTNLYTDTPWDVEGFTDMEFYVSLIAEVAKTYPVSIALPIDFYATNGMCAYNTTNPTPEDAKADYNSFYCNMRNLKAPDGSGDSLWQFLFKTIYNAKKANKAAGVNLMDFDMHGQFDQGNGAVSASHTDEKVTQNILEFIKDQFSTENQKNYMRLIKLGIAPYGHEEIMTSSANNGYNQTLSKIPLDCSGGKDTCLKGEDGFSVSQGYNKAGTTEYSVLDPANIDPMPDMGGMVDRTGVYPYSCIVDSTLAGCPVESFTTPQPNQNKMLDASGQKLPPGFSKPENQFNVVESIGNDGTITRSLTKATLPASPSQKIIGSWIDDTVSSDMPFKITGPIYGYQKGNQYGNSDQKDLGFTYDSPVSVEDKVNNLVKKYGLDGVWFWDILEDNHVSSATANNSLFLAAKTALNSPAPQNNGTISITFVNTSNSDSTETVNWTATTTNTPGKLVGINDGSNAPKYNYVISPTGKLTEANPPKCDTASNQISCITTVPTTSKGTYKLVVTAGDTTNDSTHTQATTFVAGTTPPKPTPKGDWTATANPSSATASSTIKQGGLKITLTPPQQAAASTVGTAASGDLAIQYITTSSFGASPDAKFTCVADASDASSETCTNDSAITMPDSAESISLSFTTQSTDSSTSSPYKIDEAQFTINPAANPSKQAFRIMDGTTEVASSSDAVNTGFDNKQLQVVTGKIHLNDTLTIESEGGKSQTCFVGIDGITPLPTGQSIQITTNYQEVHVTTCKS